MAEPLPKKPLSQQPLSKKRANRGRNRTTAIKRTKAVRHGAAAAALAGAGTVALALAVVAGGSLWPVSAATGAGASIGNTPVPAGTSVASCSGPARLLEGSDAGTDPQFSAASSSAKTLVSALLLSSGDGVFPGARLAAVGSGQPLGTLADTPAPSTGNAAGIGAQRRAAVLPGLDVAAPSVLSADPRNGQRAAVNGLSTFTADDGDLRGLAAANCLTPGNDFWLMGASTTVGRTSILTLVNNSTAAATVNLDLFGDQGQVQAPGARGLLVPAGESRAIVLAGLAPGQEHLAVRLKSIGGPVGAAVQQSVLRGLTPGGVDILSPAAAPAEHQVISGVEIGDPAVASELAAQAGYADAVPAVSVAVPGGTDAVMQVKVFGTAGQQALPNGGVFTAKAGGVTELSLSGLPAGTYTVDVRSDAPFTASARVIRGTKAGDPVDFGVAPATGRLADAQLLTLSPTADSKLSFGAPDGRAQVTLTPVGSDGTLRPSQSVDVAGGTSVVVDSLQLGGPGTVGFLISATGDPVYGAQVLTVRNKAAIAVTDISRGAAAPQTVHVVLGY
ncbi:MAG: hypothetical protein JWO93_2726 [Micrococcaceae bacterium]|nr:hypothetical protein [Micrococcaceae bacterium]